MAEPPSSFLPFDFISISPNTFQACSAPLQAWASPPCFPRKEYYGRGASLVVQWLRTHCRCRGHGFDHWSGKIPHATEHSLEPGSRSY